MNFKSFRATTRDEAIQDLKQALGQDAHIIAVRDHNGAVVATGTKATRTADLEGILTPASAPSPQKTIETLLRAHRVPEAILNDLADILPDMASADTTAGLRQIVARQIPCAPLDPMPKALMLFGPTGAGKTAALVRLAARQRSSGKPVIVITTDTARTGATRQLQALLAAIELEPMVAETSNELRVILERNNNATTLIDTTGTNPLYPEELATIAGLINDLPIEPINVLPAGLDPLDSFEIARNSKALGATRVIITKLDTARRFGSLFAIAKAGLTLAETSISPALAKPLIPWTPEGLTRLLERSLPHHPLQG